MGVVFLAGIYGVGKSTFANILAKKLNIKSYSAGDLICEQNGEIYGERKAVINKGENQKILVKCVNQILQNEPRIVLAGHFCILNRQNEIEDLPSNVYSQLQIEKIILLQASPDVILSHLKFRDGKEYPIELIHHLSKREYIRAFKIAKEIDVKLIIHDMMYSDEDVKQLIQEF